MEFDIKENENEPELTYPYEEVDPLNPLLPASDSKPRDVIEVENMIEFEDETIPASVHDVGESSTTPFLREDSDGLLHGLMRRDINSLFVRWLLFQDDCVVMRWLMHWSKRKETQRTSIMKLVKNLGNVEDKAERKKLKKELEESRKASMLLSLLGELDMRAGNDARGSGPVRGQDAAPIVCENTFYRFMKCNPTSFHGTKRAVELRRWFEKTESVLGSVNVKRERRINELSLMCPTMVKPKRVKVDAYIKCHKCGKVGHKARYCKEKNVATGANAHQIPTCYDCGDQGHTRNRCPRKVKQEETGEVRGRAYAIKDAEPQGASYEVELADGRVVSMSTFLKGCTLNLVNHIFEIDLMPIELGTFDVIIGMDWLVKHDAAIICGEKVVHIPYENKMLIVKSDKGVSRLKKSKEKRLEDVPVIHDFPKVFPEEFPGLPPPRQVEF
nr:hypothetical protein [Tanacetum cinerariifolium]